MNYRNAVGSLVLLGLAALAACDQDSISSVSGPTNHPRPVIVPTPQSFVSVDMGRLHSCSLRTDGVVECWGYAANGQAPSTKTAASGSFASVSAGWYHTCALRTDGVFECWGGSSNHLESPLTKAAASGSFTSVSAGGFHTCALRTDGVVECWGDEYYGQAYGQAPSTKTAASGSFTSVSAGGGHTCALRTDGVVECWGDNSFGQAPSTNTAASGSFTSVSAGAGFEGTGHTCALRTDGVVECWGDNSYGQAPSTNPAASGSFTSVSAGERHTCALRTDGVIECWGGSDYGQAPSTKTAASGNFTSVSAGGFHTCALPTNGVVECWGYNDDGAAPATKIAQDGADHVYPTATFNAATSVTVGNEISLSLTNAAVPGFPAATSFTYAFRCQSDYSTYSSTNTASCPTDFTGTRSVGGKVKDSDGDVTEYTAEVSVTPAPPNTTVGTNVDVVPTGPYPSSPPPPITLQFGAVTDGGVTTVTTTTYTGFDGPPPPPAPTGFQLGDPPTFYDITTTATFSGLVSVCIDYSSVAYVDESQVKLLHYDAGTDTWADITSPGYPNTETNQLCGMTSSFSPFLVAQQLSRPQTIQFTAPASPAVIATSATLSATGGGSASPVVFTSLTSSICSVSGSSVSYVAIGTCTLAADQAPAGTYLAAPQVTRSVSVIWPFNGFTPPVLNSPTVNGAKSGSSIPLKFTLGGNRGLVVIASGYPTVTPVSCTTGEISGAPFRATGSLTFDVKSATYTYSWKTDKTAAPGCARFTLVLVDGSSHSALFSFK